MYLIIMVLFFIKNVKKILTYPTYYFFLARYPKPTHFFYLALRDYIKVKKNLV